MLSNTNSGNMSRSEIIHPVIVDLILLDRRKIKYGPVQAMTKGKELLDYIFGLLQVGERERFGFRFEDQRRISFWLTEELEILSQLKNCSVPHQLYFGVKFYPEDPLRVCDAVTRTLLYLQLKQDLQQNRLPVDNSEDLVDLAAVALQAELGDSSPDRHLPDYSPVLLFRSLSLPMMRKIEQTHGKIRGLPPVEAEYNFLVRASCLDLYGAEVHNVEDCGETSCSLGLAPTAILLIKDGKKLGEYPWLNIADIFRGDPERTNRCCESSARDSNTVVFAVRHNETYKIKELSFRLLSNGHCEMLYTSALEHIAFYRRKHRCEAWRPPKE